MESVDKNCRGNDDENAYQCKCIFLEKIKYCTHFHNQVTQTTNYNLSHLGFWLASIKFSMF